jgi:predicted secreted hydrolase
MSPIRKEKTRIVVGALGTLVVVLFVWGVCRASEGFLQALGPRKFRFPEDHADHPGFQTEWWYYTGNLVSRGGRALGFQLTFFRVQLKPALSFSGSPWRSNQIYFAHFTVSDLENGEFLMAEKAGRGAMGIGGVSLESEKVHVFLHGWEAVVHGNTHHLRAEGEQFGIELELISQKPPVLHGENGLSQKGLGPGRASYYYSLTRMKTRGVLRLGNDRRAVSGFSWMDHEFSSNILSKDQVGWDWMGLQLSGNNELMLYALRHRDGSIDPFSSGTLVKKDGSSVHLPKEAFGMKPTDFWKSQQSGARYPSGWQVEVLPYHVHLRVTPNLKDQELITTGSTQVTYWEGSVGVTGTVAGEKVTGSGYVELTGYGGGFELGFQEP